MKGPSHIDATATKAAATLPADGEGVRVLSSFVNSPTLSGLRAQLVAKMPKAKWVEYEPLHDDAILEGSQIAFNDSLRPHYDFKKANVVVALDSDFLPRVPEVPTVAHLEIRFVPQVGVQKGQRRLTGPGEP